MKQYPINTKKVALIAVALFVGIFILLVQTFTVRSGSLPAPSAEEKIIIVTKNCENSTTVNHNPTQIDEARKIAISRPPPNRARVSNSNYGKTAMIWAGRVGTALQHADQIRKHLLEPNNMDIYVLTDRTSALLSRYGEADTRDVENVLNQAWGDRLRGLWFVEEDVGFRISAPLHYAQNELRLSALELFVDYYRSTSHHNETEKLENALHWESGISFSYPYSHRWNWWAVDQYSRLQRLAQLAKPLIFSRGYDGVLRFRADTELMEDVLLTDLEMLPNRMYVVPHTGGTITEVWLAEPTLSIQFAEKFIEDYLRFLPNVFRHKDAVDHNDMLYWTLAPQSTFMQMVRRYNIDVQSICYDFHSVDSRSDSYKIPIKTLRFTIQSACSAFHPASQVVDDFIVYQGGEYVELPKKNE